MKRYDDVNRIISQNRLRGQFIIAYLQPLQPRGSPCITQPDVALHFLRGGKTRVALALDCGAIYVAHETALALDDPNAFRQITGEALVQGNLKVAEKSLQKVKDMNRLALL